MSRQRSFQFPVLLCIIALLASCNGGKSTTTTTDSTGISSADKTNAVPQQQNLIGNYLDTLWVDSGKILALHQGLAFRFYIDDKEGVLMNGWIAKGNGSYDPDPDIMLSKGRPSTIQYKAGDYLGNLLLSPPNLADLRNLIQHNHSKYVLFAPIDPAIAAFKGQVTYNIMLSSDDPQPLVKPVNPNIVPTGIITNPSPPGTAN